MFSKNMPRVNDGMKVSGTLCAGLSSHERTVSFPFGKEETTALKAYREQKSEYDAVPPNGHRVSSVDEQCGGHEEMQERQRGEGNR